MENASKVTEQQTTAPVSTNASQLGSREELKCLLQAIKWHRDKCLQNRVISESLTECLARTEKHDALEPSESALPAVVVNKVSRLVCLERLCDSQSVIACRELAGDAATNVLGLSWESVAGEGHGLLEKEKQLVKATVEQQLLKKQRRHQLKKFKAYKGNENNSDTRNPITENLLYNNLLQNHVIVDQHWAEVERLLGLRQCFVQQIVPQKIAYLENQLELCQAQKRYLDAALLEIILNEVPKFSKALKIVYFHLKEDNESMVLEIDKKKKLLIEYQKLKGTRFDMLVVNYKTLLIDIKHSMWCLNNLK